MWYNCQWLEFFPFLGRRVEDGDVAGQLTNDGVESEEEGSYSDHVYFL